MVLEPFVGGYRAPCTVGVQGADPSALTSISGRPDTVSHRVPSARDPSGPAKYVITRTPESAGQTCAILRAVVLSLVTEETLSDHAIQRRSGFLLRDLSDLAVERIRDSVRITPSTIGRIRCNASCSACSDRVSKIINV